MQSEYKFLNEKNRTFLSRGYVPEGSTAEDVYKRIAYRTEEVYKIPGFARKFDYYNSRGWFSLASPVISNFGLERGLPISCNNSHFEDSIDSIIEKVAEIEKMTKMGAGTSAFLGELRPRGSKISGGGTSYGPVHFAELIQTAVNIISQSNVRRGNCAVWLPVEHKDVMEFLEMREEGHAVQHLSFGVTMTRQWVREMIAGDMEKRAIWWRIIRKRFETGYPYIMFYDNVNDSLPAWYKNIGAKVRSSNLCTEITEPSTADESFVCDLSSLNLAKYDEWKDTDLVETLIIFLDMIMEEYIQKTENMPFMSSAHRFARRHRSLGLGVLGWHTLLQQKDLPFGSKGAFELNREVNALIQKKSVAASEWLAQQFGEPEVLLGYGRRNTMLNAIAPTKSSSFILGSGQISASVEPWESNYYIENLAKTKITIRNEILEKRLQDIGMNNDETWMQILLDGGSVRGLDIDPHIKEVFKTFDEIDMKDIILQTADRQQFIDQSQSINLKYRPDVDPTVVSRDLLLAEATGVKTLYYQHGINMTQEFARGQTADANCVACEA